MYTQLHNYTYIYYTHIYYTHARALAHIISSGMFPISQKFNYLGEKITKKFLIMHFKKKDGTLKQHLNRFVYIIFCSYIT